MILLDTHALIWAADNNKRLTKEARRAIEREARKGGLRLASFTLFEIAALLATRQLRSTGTVEQTLRDYVEGSGALVLDLTSEIATTAAQLPPSVPSDPGDRLIVATALVHAIPLVTKDARIQESLVCKTIW